MASSSALVLASNYEYKVFCSFHGPDVRKTLLSHIRKEFENKAIKMFDDEGIERGAVIAPSLKDAIRESRISIVILSEKYASSSWCLDELVEILECKKTMGQIVMTIFYGVDPSHVRKQNGKFGTTFDETCASKTNGEKQKWTKALEEVSNIAGEDFLRWKNEAKMIEKIAKDVLDKLNATPSRDFDDMVGLEAHLRTIQSLLDLDNDGVKIVAVTGPAGIGKTTIARALYDLLANKFQLSCFVNNLRESSHSGFDEHGLKLSLQEQFLSKILNQNGIRISHLGAIKENLGDQRVLIILDDVNNRIQLEALAKETTWFGSGSRILVTTENKELLQQHDDITNTYNVGFPSDEDALKISCKYAFIKTSPWHGFGKLAESVIEVCGKLPLGLSVVGSTLRGKKEDEWEEVISRLKNTLDGDHQYIEDVLSVGYESLDGKAQKLFLHIAVFFNCSSGDRLKIMFANSDLDVKNGLKILERRSLIEILRGKCIVMHKLLQQMGKKAIQKQKPWKRQILIDPEEICAVLEGAKDTGVVSGISFDISNIDKVCISKKAFKRFCNLRFLKVYNSRYDGIHRMYIPEEMELPRRLRLLHWEAYPCKNLRSITIPNNLVELRMRYSQLENLWEGAQPLQNLKQMDMSYSKNLKELPDFSNATNLKYLDLDRCESLVEIPSSFSHLHKLQKLKLVGCINLQVIPADMNLASLEWVFMKGCSRLRNIPLMSTNLRKKFISRIPDTCLPSSLQYLNLEGSDVEDIPDCIKDLHLLSILMVGGCRRLKSLPELPPSLDLLLANNCESMETIFLPLNAPHGEFEFGNCFKLGQKTRRKMIQNPSIYERVIFPGKTVPAEFDQRAKGKTLTVVLDGNNSYLDLLFCVLISPHHDFTSYHGQTRCLCPELWCRPIGQSVLQPTSITYRDSPISSEHLIVFRVYSYILLYSSEGKRELMFEFSIDDCHDIIECGAKIWSQEKSIEESYESVSDQESYESESGSKEGSHWHLTYKAVGILSTVAIFLFFCLLCSIFLKFK